jgi:hypothetical protein
MHLENLDENGASSRPRFLSQNPLEDIATLATKSHEPNASSNRSAATRITSRSNSKTCPASVRKIDHRLAPSEKLLALGLERSSGS